MTLGWRRGFRMKARARLSTRTRVVWMMRRGKAKWRGLSPCQIPLDEVLMEVMLTAMRAILWCSPPLYLSLFLSTKEDGRGTDARTLYNAKRGRRTWKKGNAGRQVASGPGFLVITLKGVAREGWRCFGLSSYSSGLFSSSLHVTLDRSSTR